MSTTHTPGPWLVNGPTIVAAPTDAQPTGHALAHVLNPYAGATGAADRVAANARLIAAAPAMLEALQWVTRCLERPGPHMDPQAAIERARAAIAAATSA